MDFLTSYRNKNKDAALSLRIAPPPRPPKSPWYSRLNFWLKGKPDAEKRLTTLYFGERSAGKTYHQSKEILRLLKYLDELYRLYPTLPQAIILSIQKFNPTIEEQYIGHRLFYWDDADELHYCPRKDCWKGKRKHRLHDAYIVFDDMSTILPPENWQRLPTWFKKMFYQQAHFGIHIIGTLVDPFVVDITFRRCVDVCYRFKKIAGSRRPEIAKPPVKRIWGLYVRRKVKAKDLWRIGNPSDYEIVAIRQAEKEKAKAIRGPVSDIFAFAGFNFIKKKYCDIYDTLQDVPEYTPKGFSHFELHCVDPKHNHTDPKAPNYCDYKKVFHEIV